jgi:hypothetical protein
MQPMLLSHHYAMAAAKPHFAAIAITAWKHLPARRLH